MGEHDATEERPAFQPGDLIAGGGQNWPHYPPEMGATAVHPQPAFVDQDAGGATERFQPVRAPDREYVYPAYQPGDEPPSLRRRTWAKALAWGLAAGITGTLVYLGTYTQAPAEDGALVGDPETTLPAASSKPRSTARATRPAPQVLTSSRTSSRPPTTTTAAATTVTTTTTPPTCLPPLCPPGGGR